MNECLRNFPKIPVKLSHRCLTILSLSSLFALSACQKIDPAIYQCQELLEAINTTVLAAQNLTQPETSDPAQPTQLNLETWLQAADVLKKGSEAIADLSITDSELKTYQAQISKIYSDQAQATYDMVKARQDRNLDAALTAQKLTKAAGELEATTGQALNAYCQAKEKSLTDQTN